MSLQKIGKYTEIFESSRKLQRPTKYDYRRTSLIQCIAIAGLIEAGAPYSAENGEIIIDTGVDFKSVFINDVYPYLSPEGQMKVMVENAKVAELPAPQTSEQELLSKEEDEIDETIPLNKEIPEFASDAAKKEEKKRDPIKMMDGLESYDPSESVELSAASDEMDVPGEDLSEQFKSGPENHSFDYGQHENYVSDNNIVQSQPVTESPGYGEIQSMGIPEEVPNLPVNEEVNQTDPASVLKEEPVAESSGYIAQESSNDIITMNKNDLTYERCNLEIIRGDGSSMRFSVHSAPLAKEYEGYIIARLKGLGEQNGYIKTECGTDLAFAVGDLNVYVRQMYNTDGTFGCQFWSDNPTVIINKINVETGGNGGNLVIYDENLEIRVYPFHNVRNQETRKMEFGNNSKGEAAFLYYINNNGSVVASSGIEREPSFIYEKVEFIIKARWNGDEVFVMAEDVRDA